MGPGKLLDPAAAEPITFTVSNNGTEALIDVTVSDELTGGVGAITDLVCTFPDGMTGTTWAGPFAVGTQFTCTGTLPALPAGSTHADLAMVTAIGQLSGVPVEDTDTWNAHSADVPGPVPNNVPTPPAVPPVVPAWVPTSSLPVLASTGVDAAPLGWIAALMIVGGGLAVAGGRRRSATR